MAREADREKGAGNAVPKGPRMATVIRNKVAEVIKPDTKLDPIVLENNWKILDLIIFLQLFMGAGFMYVGVVCYALDTGGKACMANALLLWLAVSPSFYLLVTHHFEASVRTFSGMQLLSAFLGFGMVAYGLMVKEAMTTPLYVSYMILWTTVVWQFTTTLLVNWVPYRRVQLDYFQLEQKKVDSKIERLLADHEKYKQHRQFGVTRLSSETSVEPSAPNRLRK